MEIRATITIWLAITCSRILSDESLCLKACVCTSQFIECKTNEELHLRDFQRTRLLNIVGSNIPHLAGEDLSFQSELETLILTSVNLESLEESAFKFLLNIKVINLTNNSISLIAEGLFNLDNLEELNLSHNEIYNISGGIFNAPKLSVLDVSHNKIRSLDELTFANLQALTILDLSHNKLENLPIESFSMLINLRELNLCNNYLKSSAPSKFQLTKLANLTYLDLSYNRLDEVGSHMLRGLKSLQQLNLSHNTMLDIQSGAFIDLQHLKTLDLCGNDFITINGYQLAYLSDLKSLYLCDMPHLEGIYFTYFFGLKLLENLQIYNNIKLKTLQISHEEPLLNLKVLNLRGNSLRLIPNALVTPATKLEDLNLADNTWVCNCHLFWFKLWLTGHKLKIKDRNESECHNIDDVTTSSRNLWDFLKHLNCSSAKIEYHQLQNPFRIGSSALLECQASGYPHPSISWVTPQKFVFHWSNPKSVAKNELFMNHPKAHYQNMSELNNTKFQILNDGNLYITKIQKEDVGIYICLASNRMSNATANLTLVIDHDDLMEVKIESTLFGIALSVAFMLSLLLAQLVNMILNRWGCCCQEKLSPKYRKIRNMLYSIEAYRGQQLHKLRENYAWQLNRIKDNCHNQLEKLRETYGVQIKPLKEIKEYGTHQLNFIWEQYNDQAKKIRDYSTQQMNRVYENYVFQRNKIREFRIQQLIKLRETYKLQQQTLNKVLENLPNLNIDHCKTGGGDQSDSIVCNETIRTCMNSHSSKKESLNSSENSLSDEYYTPVQTPNLKRNFETNIMYLNNHGPNVDDNNIIQPYS